MSRFFNTSQDRQDGSIVFEKVIKDTLGNPMFLINVKSKGNKLYICGLQKSSPTLLLNDILVFGRMKSAGIVERMHSFKLPSKNFEALNKLYFTEDSIILRVTTFEIDSVITRYPATFVYDYDSNLLNSYLSDTIVPYTPYFDELVYAYLLKRNGNSTDIIKLTPYLNQIKLNTIHPSDPINTLYRGKLVMEKTNPAYYAWTEQTADTIPIGFVARFSPTGNILWKKQIPLTGNRFWSPIIMEKGILFNDDLIGMYQFWADSTIGTDTDPYIFQVTSDGQKFFSWKIDLDSTKNWSKDIAIDHENNIIITGMGFREHPANNGMFVAKINPPLYIQTSSSQQLEIEQKDISISPNPFRDRTTLIIKGVVNREGKVPLTIINTSGKIVRSQMIRLESGTNKIYIENLSNLPIGSYWFSVETNNWTAAVQTVKM